MGFKLGDAPHGYPQSQTLSPQVPQKATVGLGCSRRPTEDRPIGSPGTLSTPGPMGLCIRSVGRKGRDLGHYCGRLGREMLEVRQRQRWRSEGIGIQRLRVDTAVSALDEASGLMKPEPEVRTSFHPDRRSPDDSRISGLRHARTAVLLGSCHGRPKPDAVRPVRVAGAGSPQS